MKTNYPRLFQPVRIGNLEIKNCFHMSSMGGNDEFLLTGLGENMKKYYLERAKGGVGLLATGTVTIRKHPDRYITEEQFLTEDVDEALFKLSADDFLKSIHAMGAKMMVQLSIGTTPSKFVNSVFSPSIACDSFTKEELQYFVKRYTQAAKLCKDAGFDMIEIHSVHTGYIPDQLCTAATNHRTDEYGGSPENRARFICEVIRAVKEACGKDYPVSLKIGATTQMYEILDDGSTQVYTRELDETLELLPFFEAAGLDAFNVDDVRNNSIYVSQEENIDTWKKVKEATHIPLIAAGSLANPELCVRLLEEGYCDMISMGRQMLCDPYYINKLKTNKEEDIRFCLRCNAGCIANCMYGYPTTCAINPQAGKDAQQVLTPAVNPKRVMVIGGGVAGMEAALIASQRGHDVTLYEKKNELGGLFIAAAAFDYKDPDKKLLAWYRRQLERSDVKVMMGTEVSREMIEADAPDVVIVATGSHPVIIKVPGYDRENVILMEEACLKAKPIGQKVTIIGGGVSGCELAAQLGSEGKEVTIVERLPQLMSNQERPVGYNDMALTALLHKWNVDIRTGASLKEITAEGVVAETEQGDIQIAADTVVMGVGFRSNNTLYRSLQDYAGEVYNIGDSERFSNIYHAIWQGFDVACGI